MNQSTTPDRKRFDAPPALLDDDTLSTRRELLCRVMGMTIAAAAVGSEAQADVEQPDVEAPIDPAPMLFKLDTRGMRPLLATVFVEVDPESREMRFVPRWEALADDPNPQPRPFHVEIHESKNPAYVARHGADLVRFWEAGDVERCRLCKVCDAFPFPAPLAGLWGPAEFVGEMHCSRPVPLGTTDEQAALWSEQGA